MIKKYYLLVDAGNSLCKYFLYEVGTNNIIFSGYFNYDKSIFFESKYQAYNLESIFICSVKNTSFIENFKSYCLSLWECNMVIFNPKNYPYIASDYLPFGSLGSDRWASILALSLQKKTNFCVIDCGTAITVDYVINNRHIGGLIGPGLNTLNSCLNRSTDNINNVLSNYGGSINYYEISTTQCILSASRIYYQGFIDALLSENQTKYGADFTSYITGGDNKLYINKGHYNLVYKDNLVIKGLFLIKKFYSPSLNGIS